MKDWIREVKWKLIANAQGWWRGLWWKHVRSEPIDEFTYRAVYAHRLFRSWLRIRIRVTTKGLDRELKAVFVPSLAAEIYAANPLFERLKNADSHD